ncbi:hypothetical protein PSQ40_04795 [Curvibacter sp. HBC61]|uniref:Uncharacterized protein n=1 Tax=Curvibacter cyanobacteriorum TaxID=3026422 RepID=A0ABT5MVN8_9BURK|nr:hypothetical protein [Curvibacter sp. HBC61]MDD0837883.1 hypothetical protein [Curvibacter sp. HBC61]
MSHDNEFIDPSFSKDGRRKETAELRQQVPIDLLQIYDAVSLARGKERFEVVLEVLQKAASQWMHEATLIHRVTRGNPANVDSDGGDRA